MRSTHRVVEAEPRGRDAVDMKETGTRWCSEEKKQLKIKNILELNLAHKGDLIKILGRGKLESPVEVYAHKFSKSAENSIEKAGGKVIKL